MDGGMSKFIAKSPQQVSKGRYGSQIRNVNSRQWNSTLDDKEKMRYKVLYNRLVEKIKRQMEH
jgi:hypothetical protein